jgi:predicted Zn-dependent protease
MDQWARYFYASARALILLLVFGFLEVSLHGQTDAAIHFEFNKVDTQFLAEIDEADQQLVKKGLVYQNAELDDYLRKVGKRVIGDRSIPEHVEFRFNVLRDTQVNAFAMPNGSIYVTTGLLAVLENEAQLAAVLGHETSHVYDRHGYLRNRSERKKALAINIVQGVGAFAPGSLVGATMQLASVLSSDIVIATIYGYSREMERQADSDGLTAMVASSYDPAAMARSFELMDANSRLEFEPIQGFYQDHPKLSERRASALEFASTHPVAKPLPVSEAEYLAKVAPAICYNIEADIDGRRARSALVQATRLAQAAPNEPKYQVLLADSYPALGAQTPVATEDELNRHGQVEDRKEYFAMTEQERQRRLLQKPGGEATLHDNLGHAEKLYVAVIQQNPTYAGAYRSLGFLYEQEAKYTESAAQYRHYLELVAGTSIDRLRIERRLANVEKLAALHVSLPQ